MPLILTENEHNGFSGQSRRALDTGDLLDRAERVRRFDLAARALIVAYTNFGIASARAFLDSKDGRRFADTVTDYMACGVTFDAGLELALVDWARVFERRSRGNRKVVARLSPVDPRLEMVVA